MRCSFLIMAILVLCSVVFGQAVSSGIPATAPTGSIQGKVLGDGLKPVAGAFVTASRRLPVPLSQTARTAPDGSFQVERLPEGAYTLCVQVPDGGHLDPCQWSASPVSATLSTGQKVTGLQIALRKTSKLRVRIEDPNHHLAPRSVRTEAPQISLGVITPLGATSPAVLTSTDANGRTYEIAVALDVPLSLTVVGKHLILADANGSKVTSSGAVLNFQHVTGSANQTSYTFVVAGRTE